MRTLHVGLRVAELERSLASYTALGYQVLGSVPETEFVHAEPPASPDGTDDFWTPWLTDPDGYRIELVQWPTGHADGISAADLTGVGPAPKPG